MDDRTRGVYRAIAIAFMGIGGIVLVLGLLESLLGFAYFRGDPSWVGLFIVGIGGLLWWTVRGGEG